MCLLPSRLVLGDASSPTLATARTTSTAATSCAKTRVWCRLDDEPIKEEIDRVRHDLDGIERRVVKCVSRTLYQCQCGRHASAIQFVEEIDAR